MVRWTSSKTRKSPQTSSSSCTSCTPQAWPRQRRITSINPARSSPRPIWSCNTLWRDGQLVGIIDWEDAAFGDPLADVANGRLEILWAFGIEAMQRFTQQYQFLSSIDFTNLPYWDLCAALRAASKLGRWG